MLSDKSLNKKEHRDHMLLLGYHLPYWGRTTWWEHESHCGKQIPRYLALFHILYMSQKYLIRTTTAMIDLLPFQHRFRWCISISPTIHHRKRLCTVVLKILGKEKQRELFCKRQS